MVASVHRSFVMSQNFDPVQMYGSGTVIAASLVVLFAAVGMVLALQMPVVAVVAGGAVFVASSTRRLSALRQRRREGHRARQVCIESIGVCVEV